MAKNDSTVLVVTVSPNCVTGLTKINREIPILGPKATASARAPRPQTSSPTRRRSSGTRKRRSGWLSQFASHLVFGDYDARVIQRLPRRCPRPTESRSGRATAVEYRDTPQPTRVGLREGDGPGLQQ